MKLDLPEALRPPAAPAGPAHGAALGPSDHLIGAAILLIALAVIGLVIGFSHRPAEHALALVTVQDCQRIFDDDECRALVAEARATHTDKAPRFSVREACELVFGFGRCEAIGPEASSVRTFIPSLAAIALTRDRSIVIPLYAGPMSEDGGRSLLAGRGMYFRGRKVGTLSETEVGGGPVTLLLDGEGQPLTATALRDYR